MAVHKYKVGQVVGLLRSRLQMPSTGNYKVLTLMPPTEGENQYRIKGTGEPFERVVKEGDLVRR